MPKYYKAKDAPATSEEGDLQYNEATGAIEQVNAAGNRNGRLTGVEITTGMASTNSVGPAFYIPTVTGAPVGVVPSLGGRAAIVYDTTRRAIVVRQGGSWFTTISLSLA